MLTDFPEFVAQSIGASKVFARCIVLVMVFAELAQALLPSLVNASGASPVLDADDEIRGLTPLIDFLLDALELVELHFWLVFPASKPCKSDIFYYLGHATVCV